MEEFLKLLDDFDNSRSYGQAKDKKTKIESLESARKAIRFPPLTLVPSQTPYIAPREVNGKTFVEETLKRPEFSIHRFNQSINTNGDFIITPNQKFLKTFMSPHTPYRSIFLYHEVGVGKTCAAIQIAESFKNMPGYHKTKVLAPDILQRQFKDELFNYKIHRDKAKEGKIKQCVPFDYLSQIPNIKDMKPAEIEARVAKLIANHYNFSGYVQFQHEVDNLKKKHTDFEEVIRKKYSNMVLIIDEVHNIRSANREDAEDKSAKKKGEADTEDKKMTKKVTDTIKLVLKHAENIRLVILSATPIFDDELEMYWIINFIHANERLPEIPEKDNKPVPEKILAEFANKYVSYMRGENPETFPLRLVRSRANGKESEAQVMADPVLYETEIHPSHLNAIEKCLAKSSNENNATLTTQLWNVVFSPNGGKLDSIVNKVGEDQYEYRNAFEGWLDAGENLENHAPKMQRIVEAVQKAKGLVLIYSRFLDSGVYPMAIALESVGITRHGKPFMNTKPPVKTVAHYGLITGESGTNKDVLKTFTSSKNIDGSQMKVLIMSNKGTEGLDLKCIREVHILEPWFNMSRIEQVIGRAVRNMSHHQLPAEKRNTTIYYHAAVFPDTESPDMKYYKTAQEKRKKSAKTEQILKTHALDCNLNSGVNTRTARLQENQAVVDSRGIKIEVAEIPAEEFTCVPQVDINATAMLSSIQPKHILDYDISIAKHVLVTYFAEHEQIITEDALFAEFEKRVFGSTKSRKVFQMALDSLLKERTPLHGNGTLVKRGKHLVYQPNEIDDTTIPPSVRFNSKAKKTRVLRVGFDGFIEAQRVQKRSNLKNEIEAKVQEEFEKLRAQCRSAFESYNSMLSDKHKQIKKQTLDGELLDKAFRVMTVDRLSNDERGLFLALFLKNVNKELNEEQKKWFDSFVVNNIMDKTREFFYSNTDNKYYCFSETKENKYGTCSENAIKNIPKEFTKLVTIKKSTNKKSYTPQEIFKLRQNWKKGAFVYSVGLKPGGKQSCVTVHVKNIEQLIIAKWKELFDEDIPEEKDQSIFYIENKKATKNEWCLILEMLQHMTYLHPLKKRT